LAPPELRPLVAEYASKLAAHHSGEKSREFAGKGSELYAKV
jgi:hypothetical protein